MTDNEIIKALKECLTEPCSEQAYINAVRNSLDLINRQKAEIKKCENIIRLADKTIEKQSAEIKRLEQENFDRSLTVETWKWEAVKECIEKIKTRSSSCVASKGGIVIASSRTYTISEVKLYEIEKEMVGEG